MQRVLAVAAYNQGQSSARNLFRLLQKEIGKKPEEITLKEFVEHLTPQRVQQALKGSRPELENSLIMLSMLPNVQSHRLLYHTGFLK